MNHGGPSRSLNPRRAIRKPFRMYVNRNTSLGTISHVGFDMDYTLARYRKERIERLAFHETIKKLVEKGYPEGILDLRYDPLVMIRGLVIDKKLGNILKMDRFGYVSRAYHGMRMLSEKERKSHYSNRRIRLSDPRYHSMDTLFDLPEAHLYAQLVDYLEYDPDGSVEVEAPDYHQIFADTRECLDLSHRDWSLKRPIMEDPERYIHRDRALALTLDRIRESGRRVFLCTNSEWEYTERIMDYLLSDALKEYPGWADYFDRILVQTQKPAFFEKTPPFFDLDDKEVPEEDLKNRKILKQGNSRQFMKMEGVEPDAILYVGDHIYGDILRSKKTHGWRTVMIVEELEGEIESGHRARSLRTRLRELEYEGHHLDHERHRLQRRIDAFESDAPLPRSLSFARTWKPERIARALAKYRERILEIDGRIRSNLTEREAMQHTHDATFNANWGPLLKDGNEISRFGNQVKNYACLYTSRVTNFLSYPLDKVFQTPMETMPHDEN